jgi:N-acetyl-anhydromuramyl-L-alanine amidase AmpD
MFTGAEPTRPFPSVMKIEVLKGWLPSRARRRDPSTVVLHATAGGQASGSISWLRKIGLSYHYIIERDGTIFKCVPLSRIAFHAGKSFGPEGANVNDYSIGIAFANRNDGERFTIAQIDAAAELIEAIRQPGLTWITTHYLIAPGRKNDPKGFPFKQFAERVGMVPWKPNAGTQLNQ